MLKQIESMVTNFHELVVKFYFDENWYKINPLMFKDIVIDCILVPRTSKKGIVKIHVEKDVGLAKAISDDDKDLIEYYENEAKSGKVTRVI